MENADLIGYAKKEKLFSETGHSRLKDLDRTLMIEVMAKKIMEGVEDGSDFSRPIPVDVTKYIRSQGSLWENFE